MSCSENTVIAVVDNDNNDNNDNDDCEKSVNNHCRIVGYVFNNELLRLVNHLPQIHGRAQLVHELICSYGLHHKCRRIDLSRPCSRSELLSFHTEDFLDYVTKNSFHSTSQLQEHEQNNEIVNRNRIDSENANNTKVVDDNPFGFSYDCPLIVDLYETIAYLAASSIAGARAIIDKRCHYSINWFGGWHHAHRDEVSGFCYTNDIVFAILEFLKADFKPILYIDMDVHHGDGVEDAFAHTNKVITLSFHKYELGFFPGTGTIKPQNLDERSKYSSINVPFKAGLVDDQFIWMFKQIVSELFTTIQPEVIVCQCGADGLSGDRMKSFSLTDRSFKESISLLLSYPCPILFLGGGGYNLPNTARLWTTITGLIVGEQNLDSDIPVHDYFLHYGPEYELSIDQSSLPNRNTQQDLEAVLKEVQCQIQRLSL